MILVDPPLDRRVAIFDLDGCLVAAYLTGPAPKDPYFWIKVWSDPGYPCNEELIILAKGLMRAGIHVAVLTARPPEAEEITVQWLWGQFEEEIRLGRLSLTMYSGEEYQGDFKVGTIERWLKKGIRILFAIEDYKPNAEKMRLHVPVLLYECVRSQQEIYKQRSTCADG